MLGVQSANCDVVALIDADVLLPAGALGGLLDEFKACGYDGLQFGLVSEADGPGYWGAALAWHHVHSRVRSSGVRKRVPGMNVSYFSGGTPARPAMIFTASA